MRGAEVPVYAMGADRRVASRRLDLEGSRLFTAKALLAAERSSPTAGGAGCWPARTRCAARAA
jgi:hypothetical protein